MFRQFWNYTITTVLMQLSMCGVMFSVCGLSHLGVLLDFEEFCHVGKVFLVGFSHLLLCSLWVHNLQPLQITAEWLLTKIKPHSAQEIFKGRRLLLFTCRGVNATLELVPEERSLTVDFPPYVMLCFCSVLCCVQQNNTETKEAETNLLVNAGVKRSH